MSTPNPTHIIAEGMREVATEGQKGTPGTREDGQLWGAFPNTMTIKDLAAHVVSKLTDAGYSIVRVECDGSGTCPVSLHIHGCFSDDGNNCDNPEDHICDCGTCVAIEAARAERAAAAEGEKP